MPNPRHEQTLLEFLETNRRDIERWPSSWVTWQRVPSTREEIASPTRPEGRVAKLTLVVARKTPDAGRAG